MGDRYRDPVLIHTIKEHWAALVLINITLITSLSLWPLPELPDVPGSDKTHHLIAYAALMFPVALRRPPHWIWIGVLFVVYSGLIELLQPYVNRYGEWLDLAANAAGVALGVMFAEILRKVSFGIDAKNHREADH